MHFRHCPAVYVPVLHRTRPQGEPLDPAGRHPGRARARAHGRGAACAGPGSHPLPSHCTQAQVSERSRSTWNAGRRRGRRWRGVGSGRPRFAGCEEARADASSDVWQEDLAGSSGVARAIDAEDGARQGCGHALQAPGWSCVWVSGSWSDLCGGEQAQGDSVEDCEGDAKAAGAGCCSRAGPEGARNEQVEVDVKRLAEDLPS